MTEPADAASRPSRGRALVTHSRSFQSLAAIRSLGRAGVDVVAADEYAITPGGLSRHATARHVYPSPDADPDGFLASIEEAVDRHAPPDGVPYVLMPVHRETYLLARHRDRFSSKIALALSKPEHYDVLSHKARLWRFARDAGVAVPDAWFPGSVDEARQIADRVSLPAFVKVPSGASGIGVVKVDTAEELIDAFRTLSANRSGEDLPFVQVAAPGEDLCTQVLCNQGRAVAAVTYRNVTVFPEDGGPGAIRETVDAPRLEVMAKKLLEAIGFHGIAQVDFRATREAEDEPQVLEVNPRMCAGLFQAVASGVDLPKMLFDLAATGRVEAPTEVGIGTRTKTPLTGSVSMLVQAAQAVTDMEPLRQAWERSKDDLSGGDTSGALRRLVTGLADSVRMDDGVERLRGILDENEDAISLLTDGDDPMPALGLVYPVAVLLRHGRIDTALLTATEV